MRGKTWVIVIVLLVAVAAGLGFYWPFGHRDEILKLQGIVEIHEVRLGPKVGGRVKAVLVTEGDEVKQGQELVRLDVPELEAQREMQKARVREAEAEYLKAQNGPRTEEKLAARAAAKAARARLARLEKGFREEEKRQAKGDLDAAQADEQLMREELAREGRLRRTGATSQANYDLARANHDRARGKLSMAQARLDLHYNGSRNEDIDEARAELARLEAQAKLLDDGTRPEDIASAEARLAEARGRLAELEVNLSEAVIRAVETAVVDQVTVRPGDLVQPGHTVARVLRTADLWVKTYVPETDLGKVRLGQNVKVSMDAFPGVYLNGKVIHIAAQSEFTPRNIQTVDERRHQMFGIRVRIEDTKGLFKSGMAAEVLLPVEKP